MPKRGRACLACHTIKIKCELNANAGLEPPCERCVRLHKQCVLSQPKRQKDRVSELEAQVESLTRLLRAQGIQDSSVVDSPETQSTETSERAKNKRRRVEDVSSSSGPDGSPIERPIESTSASVQHDLDMISLDRLVTYDTQEQLLDRYLSKQLTAFPVVPLSGDCSLVSLRAEHPVLVYAVVYAAGPGILPLDQQDSIAKVLFDYLTKVTSSRSYTLDITMAILLTCLYYRTPRHTVQLSVYGLIELSLQSVSHLGQQGPLSGPPTESIPTHNPNVDSVDAWRAILISHMLGTAMAIFLRQRPLTNWTKAHDLCVLQLQYSPVSKPTDPWLAQLIKAEHICEQIAEQMDFWDATSYTDVSDPAMRLRTQTCRNTILNWRMTIPSQIRTPTLQIWEQLATAHMHEPVLHTATNKQSFAAPFVAENVSVTDFPRPAIVTQDHITALFELTTAVQTMIDLYTSLDAETMAAMPGLMHSSRVAYALFLLAKLYVATTAPGNTFGAVLDGDMTLVATYADKMVECGSRVRAIDERCAPARILSAAVGVKEWYLNYTSSIALPTPPYHLQEQEIAASTSAVAPGLEMPSFAAGQTDVQTAAQWENTFYYSSNTADFGLDMLFDEEPLPFREEMFDVAAAYRT